MATDPTSPEGPEAVACSGDAAGCLLASQEDWLEADVVAGFRVWHIVFIIGAGLATLVMFLCGCVRFRIPRTKQDIEADYMRKQITRKFQKQLRRIQNADMDDMDLKRALDRIRAEFKSDSESLAQSEVLSAGASIASSACNSPGLGADPGDGAGRATTRKVSDIGVSIEDLIQRRNSGIGARFTTLMGNLGLNRKRPRTASVAEIENLAGAGPRSSGIVAEP